MRIMFYLVDISEDLCPEDALSKSSEKPSKEVREEAGYVAVLQQKSVVRTSKGYC